MLEGRGGGEPGSGEGPCPFGASGRRGVDGGSPFARDPGFDALLPTFRQRTIAPIMLPAELPEEPKNVVVEAGLSGDHYGILFLRRPTGNTMERCVHANDAGTLTALPESQETTEYFQTTREETVKLSDGTEVRLRYTEPTMEGGNYDPFWEGSFERQGYTYTLTVPLADPSGDVARRALSTMVEVPDEG